MSLCEGVILRLRVVLVDVNDLLHEGDQVRLHHGVRSGDDQVRELSGEGRRGDRDLPGVLRDILPQGVCACGGIATVRSIAVGRSGGGGNGCDSLGEEL